jgi:hypothetical protein
MVESGAHDASDASRTEPLVLGAELARPAAADGRHRAREAQPSPLGSVRYAWDAVNLWRWVDAPQDGELSAFATTYAGLDSAERARARSSLTMDDFYTLLTFARRCALAAIRTRDGGKVRAALDAMSAIEIERVDWRDVVVEAGFACYAGRRLGLEPARLAADAANHAQPDIGEVLTEVAAEEVDLAEQCGYREVDTPSGPVFFGDEGEDFAPDCDLVAFALDVAAALEEDRYRVDDITVASDLPEVWLAGDDMDVGRATGALTGCVSVHADLRPDAGQDENAHFLLAFLAEATTAADASRIAAAAETRAAPNVAQVGVAVDRRCAVVIARSSVHGVPAVEDKESLGRLRPRIRGILG